MCIILCIDYWIDDSVGACTVCCALSAYLKGILQVTC